MKIVEIEWVDSCGVVPVWESRDNLGSMTPIPIVSVGYLWEATDDFVTIGQSYSEYSVGHRFTVPRGCIKKMRTIRR